jgi:hypothetical protein
LLSFCCGDVFSDGYLFEIFKKLTTLTHPLCDSGVYFCLVLFRRNILPQIVTIFPTKILLRFGPKFSVSPNQRLKIQANDVSSSRGVAKVMMVWKRPSPNFACFIS